MKKIVMSLFGAALLLGVLALPAAAFAQTYPYTHPTYLPNAYGSTQTLSAPGAYQMTLNGIGTVSVRVSGTCTSLAATLQASNDGTNYTAINLYPIATGTVAPTAVASVSAPGFWKANTVGYSSVKLDITALTASCSVTMVGTPGGDFNGTQF